MFGCFSEQPLRAFEIDKVNALLGGRTLAQRSVGAKTFSVGGAQRWEDDGLCIVADFTLYNSAELAGLVDLPAQNRIHLLGLLYQRFGTDFVEKLRGVFAFCLLDKAQRRIVVATDRYGIKPVVFSCSNDRFLIASRIAVLLAAAPELSDSLDYEALVDYLNLSAIPSPKTIYQQIRKLKPGHLLIFDAEKGSYKESSYYDIDYEKKNGQDTDFLTEIPRQIEASTKAILDEELAQGHSVGAFLSGGTDSSTVVGMLKKLTGEAKAFSIGFDEQGYNELGYARISAKHFGAELHEYTVTPDDVLNVINVIADVYDEPFGNSSVVPTYFCARLAKEHGVDTLLGGDGGDEIFGGNERYAGDKVFGKYFGIPACLRKGFIEPLIQAMPNFHPVIEKGKKYIHRANIPLPDRFYSYCPVMSIGLKNIFSSKVLSCLGNYDPVAWARDLYTSARATEDLDRLLYLDMKFTITDNDLRKVTEMVEKTGARVAYPFLDHHLVDFAAAMDTDLKVRGSALRYAFKKSLSGFLPTEVINKQKHGFGLPIGVWTRTNSKISGFVRDVLLATNCKLRPFFKDGFFEDVFRQHQETGAIYYGDILWMLLVAELWAKKNNISFPE